LIVTDTGLACAVLGIGVEQLSAVTSNIAGPMLETFVAMELTKQITWSSTMPALRHWRDRNGAEVDLILEADDGRVVAVEVKASQSVSTGDMKNLKVLRELLGERFIAGVTLYLGQETRSFGDRMWALPVQSLWERL
jgi:uncharacterized protein